MKRHVLLLLAAAVLWSLGGVLIKSIEWTPIAIGGSRSLIAIIVIGLFMPGLFKKISWSTLPGALAYAGTVILFVAATKLTSAANAIFLQYTAPVYIAIIGPWILHERTKPLDWLLIFIAICGVVLLGNLLTLIFALPWMFPVVNIGRKGIWILLLGVLQLAIPYLLYSRAIKHIRALDAAIISIIEPILNPIWVILIRGEDASFWSIVGGAIVLTTSLVRSILASRSEQTDGIFPGRRAPIPD